MAKVINCECGYTVQGADDDELVRNAEDHINLDHPNLAGAMSRADLLGMAEEA